MSSQPYTSGKKSNHGKLSILIVYIDDTIVTGVFTKELINLKKTLAKEFKIKDIGNLRYFLRMEVARSKEDIYVSQRKYIIDLLIECGCWDVNQLRPLRKPPTSCECLEKVLQFIKVSTKDW